MLPHFPQTRRRNYLQTINQGVGLFYSIGVGSFYVIEATEAETPPSAEVVIQAKSQISEVCTTLRNFGTAAATDGGASCRCPDGFGQ